MINWFNHCYPYTNFHELNLDWVIYTVKKGEADIKNFIGLNTIKYADPILWDITRQYEANTVVVDPTTGNAYISTKAVPYGTHINNTDFWTQIYNYADIIDTLREQIAYNEGLSTTATRAYSVDDLVFTNNLLYRVVAPMIAGDSFVADSNVVKTTINDELLRESASRKSADETLQDNIDAEVLAREGADDILQGNIDAEATAREDADGVLQDNIDAEVLAREGADNDIIDMINNLDVNHVYNQSTPDSGLTSNIGLKAGTYNITENTTINAQLVVPKGAIINISPGVTLRINGQILAGRYQIFNGSGIVVVNDDLQDFGYPEWFGSDTTAMITCINTFQKTILASKTYIIDSNLFLTQSNTQLIGQGYGCYYGDGRQPTQLYFTTGRLIIGNPSEDTIENFPRNITVKDMMISGTTQDDIMSVYGVVRGLFENLYLDTATCYNGIGIYKAISSYFNRCYVQCLPGNPHTFYGIRFLDISTHQVGARSASTWITDCTVSDDRPSDHAYSYGFYMDGYQSDIYIDRCEVNKTNCGIYMDANVQTWANVRVTNSVFDSILNHGLEFAGTRADTLTTFNNNYIALVASSTNSAVYITGSSVIEIEGLQVYGTNASQIGVQSTSADTHMLVSGIIRNVGSGLICAPTTNVRWSVLNNGSYTHIN